VGESSGGGTAGAGPRGRNGGLPAKTATSVHELKERVTKELRRRIVRIKQDLTRKVKLDTPGEGRGMTCKVRACLGRLEGKLFVHNGLALWQQEAYTCVGRDLIKLVALSLR